MFVNSYINFISLVKSKKKISLFLESRNIKKSPDDEFPRQTYIMIYDNATDQMLMSETFNDDDPNEAWRLEKCLYELEKQIGSADKKVLKKYERYLEIYQWLLKYTKQFKHVVFKLTSIQLNSKQTSWSIEDVRRPSTEIISSYIDEDQSESLPELISYVNNLMKEFSITEEDDQMDIIPDQ